MMYPVPIAPPNWFGSHEYVAIWLEGIALVFIFGLDWWVYRKSVADRKNQHDESVAQMEIMRNQARATEVAANAANKSAEALINSERAWIIAELVPQAVRANGQWFRVFGDTRVLMSANDILHGHHLKYKVKLTNMGRTPAQIFYFTIRYSCLGKGVTDLPENAGGSESSYRSFEHLLGGGQAIEIGEPIVDVHKYMQGDEDAIERFDKTAVIHGEVKYRHMFTTDDCYADFCYSYTASEQRLSNVGRHTKQRQQKAD